MKLYTVSGWVTSGLSRQHASRPSDDMGCPPHRLVRFYRACQPWIVGILTTMLLVSGTQLSADEGYPLAIRYWPGSTVSLETFWNLNVVIGGPSQRPTAERLSDADLALIFGPGRLRPVEILVRDRSVTDRSTGLVAKPITTGSLDHVLDRLPNTNSLIWERHDADAPLPSRNAMRIYQSDPRALWIEVDGVRLAIVRGTDPADLESLEGIELDALLLPHLSSDHLSGLADQVAPLKPRLVVVTAASASSQVSNSASANHRAASGNTMAVSHWAADWPETEWVTLQDSPWTIPDELAGLFAEKERASAASQRIFAELSANQLNFVPSNGTHTPRWNAEHMMGRELLFFSQIYAQRDNAIRPYDLNPAQMPPDYNAAHPDWDGSEMAREMHRAAAFSRRFSYLMEGLDLDQKAKGSYWTPRGLLQQMHNHYDSHTANVVKKFALPDWPAR